MKLIQALTELSQDLKKTGQVSIRQDIIEIIKTAAKIADEAVKKRFWDKVKKTKTCWLWQGAKNSNGYGVFKTGGVNYLAHKLAYEWANNKKVPKGIVLLHKCDQPLCVRSSHLSPGSQQNNVNDMVAKDRQAKGRQNGMSRLDKADIKKIRKLRAEGWTEAAIAGIMGVSRSAISHILGARTWSWL